MKRIKASKHEYSFDFISNMPNPILEMILQGLPTTEEVVRTSILSTRWRHLWNSIPYFPSLDIDVSRGPKNLKKSNKIKFDEFVSRVLANKAVDLESFRLSCSSYYNMSTVWRWIDAAMIRKVKKLDLKFCTREKDKYQVIMLPHFLLTCDSLESLRLFSYSRPLSFPDCTGYSAVKVLELNNVCCYGAKFAEKLSVICPLLEELILINCLKYADDLFSISCPKLKSLIIRDSYYAITEHMISSSGLKVSCPELVVFECVGIAFSHHFILENCSLRKAVILPKGIYELGDTICKFFARISHVEYLSLNLFILNAISASHDPERHFPTSLPNLKTLKISTRIENHTMQTVMRILGCSPNLKSLRLIILQQYFRPQCWELDVVLTNHLETVEFRDFNGEDQILAMARFILEHAKELKEMVFSWRDEVKYDEKSMETMNLVSTFNKTSSTVKVFTLLKELK